MNDTERSVGAEITRDAVDQTVDMFDKLLTRAHTQAQNELDEQLRRACERPILGAALSR